MAQKIIVTGGAGYIGTHTTVELQKAGFDVVVFDNFINSDPSSLDGVQRITGTKPELERVNCADDVAIADAFAKHSDADRKSVV